MSSLLGLGMALPERRVGNQELSHGLGRSAEEIEAHSHVETRYYSADSEGPSDLTKLAAASALVEAGVGVEEIELIIFATMTPDVAFPGAGCYLQRKLECGTVGALDIRAQCTGFLFALEIAGRYLEAGTYRRVLVAGADVHSSGLDFSPAGVDVTPLYGDGAAVAILGHEGRGLLRTRVHTDATHFERFWCEFPSSRRWPARLSERDLAEGRHYPRNRRGISSRGGPTPDPRSGRGDSLARADLTGGGRSLHSTAHLSGCGLGGRPTIWGSTTEPSWGGADTGHVSSASLGISLARVRESGVVASGDLVCLATAGAGSTWGASLLRV